MKSYLKFLSRNKLYTAVEAAGLVISLAFVILIGQYVRQQFRVARENPLGKRIYAVGGDMTMGLSWWDKAELERKLPEAEAVCRISGASQEVVEIDGTLLHAVLCEVDTDFFDFFPELPLLEGSLDEFALRGHCLVSESFARGHFDGDPIGRRLSTFGFLSRQQEELTVCGVYKDFDRTMMLSSDVLLNAAHSQYADQKEFSTFGQYLNLVKVPEGTDRELLTEKIRTICREHYPENWFDSFKVLTLEETFFCEQSFLRSGNRSVLRMLVVVVLLLLVSSVFNYINLNTALSGRRAREMATRRLLGSSRTSVFAKYIAESLLFTAVCAALALLTAYALLPFMDRLLLDLSTDEAENSLQLRLDVTPGILAVYGIGVLAVGTLVGLVPALTALRFAPVDVVRGTFRRHTKMWFGKVFIVIQNTISVVLLALACVMELQMHHMASRPLHARTEGLYRLVFYARSYDDVLPLVNRLEQIPYVRRIGYGYGFPGDVNMGVSIKNAYDQSISFTTPTILCDETVFDLIGLERLTEFAPPKAGTVWLSETAARDAGLADASQKLPFLPMRFNGAAAETVGGIYRNIPTADATARDVSERSMVVVARREDLLYGNGLLIEAEGDRRDIARAIRDAYSDFSEEQNGIYEAPYLSGWADDLIRDRLRPVRTAVRILELFMALSVLISLLGLLAMSTYYSTEKTRTIAIRKVFGSDVRRELWRTAGEYIGLVAIATVIGLPIAARLADRYLSQYEYRIDGYGWALAAAASISVALAFGSVLWQTLRAARTNPAVELKKE